MALLSDALHKLEVLEIVGSADVAIHSVNNDSRLVKPQDVFVAIKGSAFDGHDHIRQSVEGGATVIIGERSDSDVDFGRGRVGRDVAYIRVRDARLAYAHLLLNTISGIRQALQGIRFICVTGTNGKTTVATILEQLYTLSGSHTGFIGTTGIRYHDSSGEYNILDNSHTTPDTKYLYETIVSMFADGVNTIVMEASSHALEQHRVYGIPFHVAAFTNLTHDHLDYHGSMENYARSKKSLFNSLSVTSSAIVNGDDDWTPFLTRDCKGHIVSVGRGSLNDVCIVQENVSSHGCTFGLTAPSIIQHQAFADLDGSQPLYFTIPLIGRFNIFNAAICAVVAMLDGMSAQSIRQFLASVQGPRGRMESIDLPTGAVAVIDYAHTPDALDKALRTLKEIMDPNQRLHVVFGCGGDRDKSKRQDMGFIACSIADEVWLTSDNPRNEDPLQIIEQVAEGCRRSNNRNVHVFADRREAIERSLTTAEPHDVILIAGKGHEEYQIIGAEVLPFSDRIVVENICKT
ncbi:MAG: UDP-N-acetylmuramoyl-L-alanyl-D-glutamate--2,6-diaminopimelate ligase [Ignavibacteria bacterium]|nr:UDP-N-acetylmuramoyl-L-alanyl-D-glutamate--2,6-diaminopimelate ligase [Ignavibacteria bacterium]